MNKKDRSVLSLFDRFSERINRSVKRSAVSFKTHLYSFAVVNAGLFALWFLTGGGHPWFLYPLGGWGIGIAHHLTHFRNVRMAARQISASPPLQEKQFKLFRRRIRLKSAFYQHATAVASVSAYLWMINTITGVGFQWWLIPATALGMGLGVHAIPFRASLHSTEEQLDGISGLRDIKADDSVIDESRQLEAHIRKELRTSGVSIEDIKGEILPALEHYISGIQELNNKKREIEEVLHSHSRDQVRQERLEIEDKIQSTASEALKNEYGKAAESLVRHEESLGKLEERKELIDLRLRGALQNLRQLKLDLARLKTSELSTVLEKTALEELRTKTREMTAYIEDLDTGYSNII